MDFCWYPCDVLEGCTKKITMNPYSQTTFLGMGLCVTFFCAC